MLSSCEPSQLLHSDRVCNSTPVFGSKRYDVAYPFILSLVNHSYFTPISTAGATKSVWETASEKEGSLDTAKRAARRRICPDL
mmetsp:Transcript_962/g.3568  ORF Transcript_962/g.3568 Transcript_962/m.3568 type:complete len:83 (+) Transcript_962:4696-4944(+)